MTATQQPMAQRFVGESVKRSEDKRILTGTGNYVDDVQLPGMLHAAFLRSPFAHAHITSIDVSAARQVEGVVAVHDGASMQGLLAETAQPPGIFGPAPVKFTLLASDKVRLVGDPVAVVVATSRYIAEDALQLIDVEYDELPPIATVEHALDESRPAIFEDLGSNVVTGPRTNTHGDVDGAFARADRIVTANIKVHRHQNVPMECRGVVADFDTDSQTLTIHGSNQGVGIAKMVLTGQLGMPPDTIRVLCGDIGGSFGLKIGTGREEIATAALSKAIGRPVKWIEDRNEHLAFSGQAREETLDVEAAVTNEGDILGLKVSMIVDTGAYPGMGAMLGGMVENMMPGPYSLEGLEFTFRAVTTNKATYVAYRGPWASETFCRERIVDMVAKELGMEPLEVRRRNIAFQGDNPGKMVTGRTLKSATARESLEKIAELVDLPSFRKRQAEARQQGKHLGIGMATYIEAAPGPRADGGGGLGNEAMRMRLDDDGIVRVFTAQMPHGQSHETTLAQIAAEEFGVPMEMVKVVVGDSDQVPFGFTGGSRSATMAGGAALVNARALREKVLEETANQLEAAVEDLEIVDGKVGVRGVPAKAKALAEIATTATAAGTALEVSQAFDGGQGGWSGGTHCAIVEVDVETGLVDIERYIVVEDCGKLINPAVVDGQVRGGVAQGIGAVLLEKSAYDPDSGQFLAGTFMDYLLPTTTEVPRIETHHLETVPLDPDVNFRGVGEGGMVVSPATLCNAIEDALSPFAVKIEEQHLPPLRILELIGALDD
ncbi:MAG TPA: xanthine dehydrogenase family protein molybdopterin-binding subunit [Acidimicrobiales bacterium]|jgi:aerobic carbon-monoxide dehydrogenase large subunit|nr:xanthine dehydrogenase family protein molybdopterin-binding subunit [Acidimicrobiales bacterium]